MPTTTNAGPESVYGTMPRNGRAGAFEEPIYMPGNMPMPPHPHMIPPQASYHPASFPPEHYDAYYDSYKRHRSPRSKRKVSLVCHHLREGTECGTISSETHYGRVRRHGTS